MRRLCFVRRMFSVVRLVSQVRALAIGHMTSHRGSACAVGITLALSGQALAQPGQQEVHAGDYPNKPVRLIVPSAPGSGTDLVGRLIGDGLKESWGAPVVVDNRGGAGGIPAVTLLTKSPPDGYTLLLGSSGHFSFAPVLYRKLPYDPQKDLTYVSLVATQPFVIAVHPSLPIRSVKELIALAKSRPGAISYGSGGAGTAAHLGPELLQLVAGISLSHVPYRGIGPGLVALMSGEIQLIMVGLANIMPHLNGGRIKVLAVTSEKRSRVAPQLATVAESGLPDFEFNVWYGLVFPGGTPRAIVIKANAEIVKVLKSPTTIERFSTIGLEPLSTTPEQFADMVKRDAPKWERVVKAANIRVE
jgi:tripartite-type tricarboxylate transporter receptor subunit TctC